MLRSSGGAERKRLNGAEQKGLTLMKMTSCDSVDGVENKRKKVQEQKQKGAGERIVKCDNCQKNSQVS